MSRQAVSRFIRYYEQSRSLVRKPGSGRRTKLTPTVHQVVEAKMQCDDETTATQLQHLLCQLGVHISLATIKRCRKELGWTYQGSRYCQLIREPNKLKCLAFVQACIANNETFDDVIWSDKTSVQLECHRRHSLRKQGQPPKLKPRPKHAIKVHVWAGISKRGATRVCIFEGKMDVSFCIEILTRFLLPFISQKFPHSHCFMQDNDPKHTSRKAKEFFASNAINWWQTPPISDIIFGSSSLSLPWSLERPDLLSTSSP